MDKYNIISPTTDLDELEVDMANWCMLPYDLRMLSIDDCRRQYGMTVVDLYHTMKQNILRNEDMKHVDQDNLIIKKSEDGEDNKPEDMESNLIVKESIDSFDNYEDRLAQSKLLQDSPFVVILDPDIKTMAELNDKYYSFFLLNQTNKNMSNAYSIKIWGKNLYSMYHAIADKIKDEEYGASAEVDEDNLEKVEENAKFKSVEECMEPLNDRFIEASMDHDIITMELMKNNLRNSKASSVDKIYETIVIDKNEFCKEQAFDVDILPYYVPWFTANENAELGKDINQYGDIDIVKLCWKPQSEERDREILKMGWNPSIPPFARPATMQFARMKQANYLDGVKIINIRRLQIPRNIEANPTDRIFPVLFVFGYDNPVDHINQTLPHYTKVGISFKNNISKVYTFDGIDNTFNGFKLESIYDYNYIDIVAFYVDKLTYIKLLDNVTNIDNKVYKDINFNSIFTLLTQTSNEWSPDNMRIIYARYINLLLNICKIHPYKDKPNDGQFVSSDSGMKLYRVFSDHSTKFTRNSAIEIFNKLKVLADDKALNNTIQESYGSGLDELVEKLTPVSCILSI